VTNGASLISHYTFEQSDASDSFGPNPGTTRGATGFATGVDGEGAVLLVEGRLGQPRRCDELCLRRYTGAIEAWFRAGTVNYNGNLFAWTLLPGMVVIG